MGKHKRKFIDKKNAVTFHLVHRSQRDPLITDENAPQHVLVEAKPLESKKRKEEQKKFGIFFDDDYDYLQHLKAPGRDVVWEYIEVSNNKKKDKLEEDKPAIIQLPSSVFASSYEENEGMLNKAAPNPGPKPDWDPDVVAALDEDFDFENPENQLEDDFFVKAMGEGVDNEDDECFDENDEEGYIDSDGPFSDDDNMSADSELRDRLAPLMRDGRFDNEEMRSRFTEYSMSSSVIRRNEQLSLLDDRFEKFYSTYDDPELGALDMEEIEGYMDPKNLMFLNNFKEFKKTTQFDEYKKEWDKDRIQQYRELHSSDEELEAREVEDDKQKKWDCESILSTYSNLYNHPKLIEEPRKREPTTKIEIDPKTGLPKDVLKGSDKLTAKYLAKLDSEILPSNSKSGPRSLCEKSVLSTLSVLSIRPKDETPEEKRERKRLIREYRTERRMERKANTEAFKEEKKRLVKIKLNNQNNIQGNRIF